MNLEKLKKSIETFNKGLGMIEVEAKQNKINFKQEDYEVNTQANIAKMSLNLAKTLDNLQTLFEDLLMTSEQVVKDARLVSEESNNDLTNNVKSFGILWLYRN